MQIIAFRPQMIVDHIQDHGQPPGMAGIHQTFQAINSAVAVLGGKDESTVIPPVAFSGKLGHRHQFHSGYAQLTQVVKAADGVIKGTGRGKGSDMQLIDDQFMLCTPLPGAVLPLMTAWINQR